MNKTQILLEIKLPAASPRGPSSVFEAGSDEAAVHKTALPVFVNCVQASCPHSKTIFSWCQVSGLPASALSHMAQGLDLSGSYSRTGGSPTHLAC